MLKGSSVGYLSMSATVGQAVQCCESRRLTARGIRTKQGHEKRQTVVGARSCGNFAPHNLYQFDWRLDWVSVYVRHGRTGGAMLRIPAPDSARHSPQAGTRKKEKHRGWCFSFFGAPAGTRIPDTLIKRQKTQFSDLPRLCRMHKRIGDQSASCGTIRAPVHDAAGEKSPRLLYTLHKIPFGKPK